MSCAVGMPAQAGVLVMRSQHHKIQFLLACYHAFVFLVFEVRRLAGFLTMGMKSVGETSKRAAS